MRSIMQPKGKKHFTRQFKSSKASISAINKQCQFKPVSKNTRINNSFKPTMSENTTKTHLYIFQLFENIYKIGCSDNVENRLKNAKTWSPNIKLISQKAIPVDKGANWRSYEKKLHAKFEKNRFGNGGSEIFNFSDSEIAYVVKYVQKMSFK